jgi:hypothetical protein
MEVELINQGPATLLLETRNEACVRELINPPDR